MTPSQRTQFEQEQRKEMWEVWRRDASGNIIQYDSGFIYRTSAENLIKDIGKPFNDSFFLVKRTQTVEVVEE